MAGREIIDEIMSALRLSRGKQRGRGENKDEFVLRPFVKNRSVPFSVRKEFPKILPRSFAPKKIW